MYILWRDGVGMSRGWDGREGITLNSLGYGLYVKLMNRVGEGGADGVNIVGAANRDVLPGSVEGMGRGQGRR